MARARADHVEERLVCQSGKGRPDVILIGTGSETQIALAAGDILVGEGINVRVVALPSWELVAAEARRLLG